MLFLSAVDELSWTFVGSDPANWSFESSVDGLTEWEGEFIANGFERVTSIPEGNLFYRMFGVDDDSNPVTPRSNVVWQGES